MLTSVKMVMKTVRMQFNEHPDDLHSVSERNAASLCIIRSVNFPLGH